MRIVNNKTYINRVKTLLNSSNKEELKTMLSKNLESFNICIKAQLNPWEKQIWIDMGFDK